MFFVFEVIHLFSLFRFRFAVHPSSIFVQPSCFLGAGSFFFKRFCFLFSSVLFSFCVSLSFVLCLSSTQIHPHSFMAKPHHSSLLHPPILTHTHNIYPINPYSASSNNRSISSFSTSSGHHLHQPKFHQHPGKLGSTSCGVSEWRHYRIHHPVLQYGRHQGV